MAKLIYFLDKIAELVSGGQEQDCNKFLDRFAHFFSPHFAYILHTFPHILHKYAHILHNLAHILHKFTHSFHKFAYILHTF